MIINRKVEITRNDGTLITTAEYTLADPAGFHFKGLPIDPDGVIRLHEKDLTKSIYKNYFTWIDSHGQQDLSNLTIKS